MSIICQNCGTENPANARFCKQCGSRLSRVCSNCGNPLAEDARFCNYCGTPVYGTGAFNAPADTVAAPVSPVFTAAAYAVQSQPAVRKNKDHTRVRRILQIILESFSLLQSDCSPLPPVPLQKIFCAETSTKVFAAACSHLRKLFSPSSSSSLSRADRYSLRSQKASPSNRNWFSR